MDIVQIILDNCAPDTWERNNPEAYENSYLEYEIETSTSEYEEIKSHFADFKIKSMKRVQNPFQLGLFQVMKEKRESEYINENVKTGFMAIDERDRDTALKYPLDYRRFQYRSHNHSNCFKNPQFYSTVNSAIEAITIDSEHLAVVMVEHFDVVSTQGDYNPLYIVSVEK